MHTYFSRNLGKHHIFALHGFGGAGKSQIAYKFIEECQVDAKTSRCVILLFIIIYLCIHISSRFSDVFFIDASKAETIIADLEDIALAHGVGESQKDALIWLTRQHTEWLLLFDGADDIKLNLREYFPRCTHGNILITTRNRNICLYAPESVMVSGLEPDHAQALLLSIVMFRKDHSNDIKAFAAAIVKVYTIMFVY